MATIALIPVSEYLTGDFEVDCDYIEGELQERSVGERSHSLVQFLLTRIINAKVVEWGVLAIQEPRVQVGDARYRVPDVCVVRRSDPVEQVVHKAPLVCVEILSSEDRMRRILERVRDYQQMGVEHIWILEPLSRDVWRVLPDGSQQHIAGVLTAPGTPIQIALEELWGDLDFMLSQSQV